MREEERKMSETKKPTSLAGKIIKNGIIDENPTFRLVLGMCPTLAVTTAAVNGLGMGVAVTFVLICSNVFISLLRNFIPQKIRIPAFVVIIAAFVTIVQLFMQAFVPDLYDALGIFIPLIVVNCIILCWCWAPAPLWLSPRRRSMAWVWAWASPLP